jgi:hypothetical protein
VELQAGRSPDDRVEDPRDEPAPPRVAPLRLPAGDQVEALVELREQPRDLGGIVLEVGVDRHDDVAGRVPEPGGERGRLAEVAPEAHDTDVLGAAVQPGERGERPVDRPVVDEDGFPRPVQRVERARELVVEQLDAPILVVDGNDDRDHGSSLFAG